MYSTVPGTLHTGSHPSGASLCFSVKQFERSFTINLSTVMNYVVTLFTQLSRVIVSSFTHVGLINYI